MTRQQTHRWDPRCKPPKLVRPVRVDPKGEAGPTRSQASGRHWRPTTPGLYVPNETDSEIPEQGILEQSMRLPPGAGPAHRSSCSTRDCHSRS